MPIQVLMPALSPTMEKGNLAKWLKKEGETISSGDVIAEIETDKATMEVEATDEGTLGQILVPEGTQDVAVNTPIATILAEGEDAPAAKAPSRSSRPRPRNPRLPPRRTEEAKAPAPAKSAVATPPQPEGLARTRRARRHRDGDDDRARSLARRHGRGNAPRRGRIRHGRRGRGISGRL